MNNILRKLTIACLFLIAGASRASAQSTVKEITDKFFTLYASDPVKAVEYGFSTNKWFERKQDNVTDVKNKLKNLIDLLGEYYGYEQINEKTAGQSSKMVTFILRYDREPLRFTLLFYKPKDTWRLSNFTYDEDIDKDLEEASKFYRLRENMGL